jgi:hypothetical protein
MKLYPSTILILIFVFGALGQNYQQIEKDIGADLVTVTAVKSNLRDFPATYAKVITSYPKETKLILVSRNENGGWYEVANIYTLEKGWIHKSTIQVYLSNLKSDCVALNTSPKTPPPPPPLNVPVAISREVKKDDGSPSPFSAEYVSEDFPTTIEIENRTALTLNLTFGGAKYNIRGGQTKAITVEGGTYNFTASAPGVRSLTGQKGFEKGYRYSWTFIIVTRTVTR